jgi:hypothetical protein
MTGKPGGLVAAVLVLGLVASAGDAGAAGRVTLAVAPPPNVNVSRHAGNQAETAVAVNPIDPSNIVITSNLETFFGLMQAISFDGGASWTTEVIGDGDHLGSICCDSSLAFDRFGNLFLTYLPLTGVELPVALSVDGGLHFEVIDSIVPRRGSGPVSSRPRRPGFPRRPAEGFPDQPTIATGEGSVWVTYTYTVGVVIQAAGAPVFGPGEVGGFHRAEVAGGPNVGHFGDVAVGPDGQVLVTYQDVSGEGPGTILTDLDPDGLGPLGLDRASVVTETGVGDFDQIPAAATVTIDAETGLAWDRTGGPFDGRVYLLWTDEAPDESDDTEVKVQFSDDDGATWSDPVVVNDDGGSNSQFMPKIALDQTTGVVAVSWYDARGDLGLGGPGDTNGIPNDDAAMFASVSVDGGVTFGRNLRVSAASNSAKAHWVLDYGDYEGLAFEAGTFYPVWADNSNSTGDNPDGRLHEMDVYTAPILASSLVS